MLTIGNPCVFGFSQVFSALYGTGPTLTVTTLQEGNQLGGFFRLNFNGQVTAPIRHDAAATGTKSVSQRLQALGGAGTIACARSGPDTEGGYAWTVTFLTAMGPLRNFCGTLW